jgi:hypothetical protein
LLGGVYGALVWCIIPFSSQNEENSMEKYSSPLLLLRNLFLF